MLSTRVWLRQGTFWLVLLVCGSAWAADPDSVSFYTSDGVQIFADYHAPPTDAHNAPMVILLHMYKQDRSSWQPLLEPLHQAGFAVLALDLRGHGDSATPELEQRVERRDPGLFKDMYLDVRAAYDFLAEQDGLDRARFALVGASVGCSVALRYAAQDRSVDAVICLSPGTDYLGLDSGRDMRKISGRRVLLVATDDERAACDSLKPLTKGASTRIHQGKAHGTRMFGTVAGVEEEVVEFLQKAVGDHSDELVYGSIRSNIYHPASSGWIAQIKATNMRHYSSPAEAEARGLRKTRSMGPHDKPKLRDEQRKGARGRPREP